MEWINKETVKIHHRRSENVAALVKIVAVELGYLVDIAALKPGYRGRDESKNWINTRGDLERRSQRQTGPNYRQSRTAVILRPEWLHPCCKTLNKQIRRANNGTDKTQRRAGTTRKPVQTVDQTRNDSIAAILIRRDAEQGATADRQARGSNAERLPTHNRPQQEPYDVIADIPKTIRQHLEEANKTATKHAKGSSDEVCKTWEKAVGRIDEAFAGAWGRCF